MSTTVRIKNGFDGQAMDITFDTEQTENRVVRVNVEQHGLNTGADKVIQRYETLSYATLDEILILRDTLNKVIAESVGL